MKKITLLLLLSTFVFGLALPVSAQSEGRDLAELGFTSSDLDSDGFLSMAELQEQGALIFLSMDGDDNHVLTREEFMSWGYGFQNIAEDTGRVQAYETALKITFALWDRDKDGTVTSMEHRQGISFDTIHADLDFDGRLSEAEFLGSFVVNVALRTALKPE